MARRGRDGGPQGLLIVDKAPGVTSHDVVAMARRRWGQRRIGHAGTLDPPATGVLLLGVGRLTRALRWLSATDKVYVAEIVLGSATTTLDDTGDVTERHDMSHVTAAQVRAAAQALTGAITQLPPMVSAVRVGGRRLHEVARAGEVIERAPRAVVVHRFDVGDEVAPGVWPIEVGCSAGTYVRTLADDLGRALGGSAHLRSLRRTRVGAFGIDEAATIDDAPLVPPADALRGLPRAIVDDDLAQRVRHGAVLDLAPLVGAAPGDAPAPAVAVVARGGELLAVYEPHRGQYKPGAVLAPVEALPS